MYSIIIIPVLVGLVTQILKLAFDGIPKNLNWKHIFRDYGGMPSSHTALVVSLATVVAIREGFDSAAFAVAFILMAVVIRDAIGFRREIGRNAALTNLLAKEVFKNKKASYEHLTERVGHTFTEIVAGFVIGICLTIFFFWLFIIF
jgi:acid phosphatase family membrane protein YuiD